MLKHPYLEITYRKGKPFAGYLYLSDTRPQEPCRSRRFPCLLVFLQQLRQQTHFHPRFSSSATHLLMSS